MSYKRILISSAVSSIVGMTVWYVGAGLGHGSHYGIVKVSLLLRCVQISVVSPWSCWCFTDRGDCASAACTHCCATFANSNLGDDNCHSVLGILFLRKNASPYWPDVTASSYLIILYGWVSPINWSLQISAWAWRLVGRECMFIDDSHC